MKKDIIKVNELINTQMEISVCDCDQTHHELHRHNYWEIFLFKEGTGTHLIDFDTINFKENSVHIVSPYHVHQIHSSFYKGFMLKVSDAFFHASNENKELIHELSRYQLQHKVPVIDYTNEEFTVLWEIIEKMQKELNQNFDNGIVIKNYLNIFLFKCRRGFNIVNGFANISRSDLEIFIMFRHFVEKHFQNYTKVGDYLKLLGITDKKLLSICSHFTGVSPGDYLHIRILTEAKRLLLYSSFHQKEIAYLLNFTDLPHFIKFFKQRTGLLPKEFAAHI